MAKNKQYNGRTRTQSYTHVKIINLSLTRHMSKHTHTHTPLSLSVHKTRHVCTAQIQLPLSTPRLVLYPPPSPTLFAPSLLRSANTCSTSYQFRLPNTITCPFPSTHLSSPPEKPCPQKHPRYWMTHKLMFVKFNV